MRYIHNLKRTYILILLFMFIFSLTSYAAITDEQSGKVAEFAKSFIEKGNSRRDENGYPLLVYALSGNWNTCVDIRNKGYNSELYYIKNNSYHYRNGRYLELGNKWCMDCGTFVTFTLNKTLGLELYNEKEPWHVQDIYNDAKKGVNSKYFEFIYKNVSINKIDYSKLQKGDVILRVTNNGNHGMIYVGEGLIAHANKDMIKYNQSPIVLGFNISQLNQYYLGTTIVSVARIKDNIIPEDHIVNATITWPDTGETENLLCTNTGEIIEKFEEVEEIIIQEEEQVENIEFLLPIKSNIFLKFFEIFK